MIVIANFLIVLTNHCRGHFHYGNRHRHLASYPMSIQGHMLLLRVRH